MNNLNFIKIEKAQIYLFLCLVFGFILRIIGFDWGGKDSLFYPDEFNVVNNIIVMVREGRIIHSNWIYPSMSTSKIITVLLMIVSKIKTLKWIDYYYIVRFFYALFSTAVIWLSYKIVERCEGKKFALVFSIFISINPTFIKYAKIVVGDTPVMMFWLLVGLFMQNYLLNKRIKDLIIMSIFAGFAFVEKWNGAGAAIFIALGVITYNKKEIKNIIFHGFISLVTWLMTIIVLAPNILSEWKIVLRTIKSINPSYGVNLIQGHFITYFSYTGIGTIILCIIGLYVLINKKEKNVNYFSYWLFIIALVEDWLLCEALVERHGFFVFWGCGLLITYGLFYFIHKEKQLKKIGMVLAFFAICSWIIHAFIVDAVAVRSKKHDTRSIGVDYLANMGATVENSTGEYYTPYNPPYATKVMDVYDINEILYLNDNDQPCISVPGKKYIIIGEYSWKDRDGEGYRILYEYNSGVNRIESDIDLDLFCGEEIASGKWYYFELDTIRNSLNKLKRVCSSKTQGPWIEIYDISNFKYEEKE